MKPQVGNIWLASYPKSGNTWFRIFLENLMGNRDDPAKINELRWIHQNGGFAATRAIFESKTWLDCSLLSHEEIDRVRPLMHEALANDSSALTWVKTHDAYTHTVDDIPLLGRNSARAAIYLVRDPRDVAISWAHHNDLDVDASIAFINEKSAICDSRNGMSVQLRQKLLDWSGHVSSWLCQRDVPVYMVRYEDLCAAPHHYFSASLAFAGCSATEEEIGRAVRNSQFAELQQQERENDFCERHSKKSLFFRNGRVGGWRNVLTAGQAQAIETAHRPMMERFGYLNT